MDNLAAETAAGLTTAHPDYGVLAARIAISNLHAKTEKVGAKNRKSFGSVPKNYRLLRMQKECIKGDRRSVR